MPAKTVQLPEPVFRRFNALKIRIVKSTDRIPTNGDIINYALKIAERHYEEFLDEFTRPTPNRPKPLSEGNESE